MATTKAQQAWDSLNERQQIYLKALFNVDQANERARQHEGARGRRSHTPARTWRRIDFNAPYSRVIGTLRAAGVYDSGAGATLAALRTRGLIETETVPGLLTDLVHVWLTSAGRAAVRAATGLEPTRSSKPKWALSEWLWRELAKVVAAGAGGLPAGKLFGSAHLYLDQGQAGRNGNRPFLRCVQSFVSYTPKDFNGREYPWKESTSVHHYFLTDDGRAHYTDNLPAYRKLYPDVDAPELATENPGREP